MPTPEKILARKVKKQEKKKLKGINQKSNGVSENNAEAEANTTVKKRPRENNEKAVPKKKQKKVKQEVKPEPVPVKAESESDNSGSEAGEDSNAENDDITNTDTESEYMNESLILEINEEDNESQIENKWVRWHPKALKTRVSTILKPDTVTKASVTGRLDKLSAARLELVQLQMQNTIKQHQFIEDEHNLKILHLANEEARKQEIHELNLKKISNT